MLQRGIISEHIHKATEPQFWQTHRASHNCFDRREVLCLSANRCSIAPSNQGAELTNSCEASLSVGRRCCDCTESRVSVMIGEGLKSVCCPPTCSCAARNGFDGESLGLNLCWLFGERIAGDRPPGEPFLGLRKGLLEDRLRLRPGEGRRSGTVWRESSYQ